MTVTLTLARAHLLVQLQGVFVLVAKETPPFQFLLRLREKRRGVSRHI